MTGRSECGGDELIILIRDSSKHPRRFSVRFVPPLLVGTSNFFPKRCGSEFLARLVFCDLNITQLLTPSTEPLSNLDLLAIQSVRTLLIEKLFGSDSFSLRQMLMTASARISAIRTYQSNDKNRRGSGANRPHGRCPIGAKNRRRRPCLIKSL